MREMTAKIIDGRKIAKKIKKQLSDEIAEVHSKYNRVPHLTTITIGKDPASELYLKLRDNACEDVGIKSTHVEFVHNVSETKILDTIHALNRDDHVHGILIQYPLPKQISPDRLMNAIEPDKDVEGFHPLNMGRTLIGDEHSVPCTPLAVLTILEYEHTKLQGKDIVIVNHSTVVGKPLAALFLNRDATVSVCHVFTKDLHQYTCNADILVTGAGVPKLITKQHVKEGAFVIDVGIIPTKEGVTGDVDFHAVKERAEKITPVPGGVGPVTIACSLHNLTKIFKTSMGHDE